MSAPAPPAVPAATPASVERSLPKRGRGQLSDAIAERIRSGILAGVYKPGQFLRHEDLAAQTGVSNTPVREALLGLSKDGFVQHASRRGFVVLPLRRRDMEDLYELHAQISATLAQRATKAITPRKFEELAKIQARFDEALAAREYGELERLNDELHRHINRIADSPKLAWTLLTLLKYIPKRDYADIDGLAAMQAEQHRQILAAMHEGDAEGAYRAMYEHSSLAMGEILNELERLGVLEPPSGH